MFKFSSILTKYKKLNVFFFMTYHDLFFKHRICYEKKIKDLGGLIFINYYKHLGFTKISYC